MKIISLALSCMLFTGVVTAQDIITTSGGNDIQAIVIEITAKSVRYKKYENREGPLYTLDKSEVFMIKYENGTKDVFTTGNSTTEAIADTQVATIYFYRPKKFASGKTKIIVGTVEPDEVVVALKNGSWFKASYAHIGEREFVSGVFTINPETYLFKIDPGNTYYIKCTVLARGLRVMAELEFVGEETARAEMMSLKEQLKDYVD